MIKGFNRLTLRAVLVLTMALGGGLLGAGCDTDNGDDNKAGAGGEAGGEAGSGGTAGSEAGSGGGGSGGTTKPAEPEEFTDCSGKEGQFVAMEDGGVLVCVDDLFQDADENFLSLWLRSCSAPGADCRDPQTFCGLVGSEDLPYCMFNRCGDRAFFSGNTGNGDFFEACSPLGFSVVFDEAGNVIDRVPESEMTGTCLPVGRNEDGTALGVCMAGGEVAAGGECGDGDARVPSSLCAQGTVCLTNGKCAEVCDAAAEPVGEGEFAGCEVAGEACTPATSTPPTDFVIGVCAEAAGGDEGGDDEGGEDEGGEG